MLSRSVAAFLLLSIAPAWACAATGIVHVWPAYRDNESFRRISEYVGSGAENTGREITLRTQSESRDGYYFLTRIKSDQPLAGVQIVLEAVLPGSPVVHTFRFPAEIPSGQQVFQLGVTGSDWPGAEVRPAAWRISAQTADGTVLTELSSFLWSGPKSAR